MSIPNHFVFALCAVSSFSLSAAEEPAEKLPDMVVTANLVPTQTTQTGSAVTVITAEEIEQQQTIYVSDILRTVPGIAVNQSGGRFGAFTQVRIRGAEGNQTLVRLDGIELNDPSGGSEYNFGNLLAENIERIEIIRGPQSALYGSDAIGGVINIISKKGESGLKVNAKVEGGSFGTHQVGGGISGGWQEHFDFSAGATSFVSEGTSIAENSIEKDRNTNVTAYGNLSVHPLKNLMPSLQTLEIGLNGRLVRSELQTDGFQGGIGAIDADNESNVHQSYGRIYSKLNLFEDTDWIQWQHQLRATYSGNKRDSFQKQQLSSEFDGSSSKYAYQTNLLVDTPALAQSNHALTFLLEHERDQVRTFSAFSNIDRSIDTTSYIGEYRLGLFDRLFVSGSVRHDNNDKLFEDATTYRATFSYLVKETATRAHASYGTGVKNPTIFELFGFTQNFQGNPDLQPEKSHGWDAGIEQKLLHEQITLDATYFNNRIESLIQGTGRSAINLSGRTRIEGVEIALQTHITEGLDLTGAYTWTSSMDSNGNRLVRQPEHIASANLNYGFQLFGNRGNVNFGVKYNGNQTDFAFDPFFNRSIVKLDDYTLLSIAASFEVYKGVELFVRGENLLDEDYQEVFTFTTPGVAVYGGLRAALGPFFN